jgi:hypothetical protein
MERPAGTFTNGTAQSTPWTAPMQTGPVPVTVTVTCPTDGKTASDSVTIQVVAAPVAAPIVFEDVHFDFDRYSLRPEAVRTLDEASRSLQENPSPRRDRRPHLQHRHGGIQPGARRAPRHLGPRVPHQPRRQRGSSCAA